ncbi:hypothetical protein ACQP1V_43215 (plasmid) [Microtetraspora malaysiensis]|uniref:hypothetical protein n=1 Tax=Microtetraspora malaysiensis TaxID=161358 RepID=UPI003D932A15
MTALACATVVFGFPPCPFDVVGVYTTACVHEHIQDEPVCAHHLPALERGGMRCTDCRTAGHICLLLPVAVVDPDTGERRALRR